MKSKALLLIALWLLALSPLTACATPAADRAAVKTEAAATIYAGLTAQAGQPTTRLSPAATSTATLRVAAAAATRTPTPTRRATSTRSPTPSPPPTATPTVAACLPNAAFVADVTVPDGTNFSPGERFTKTWQMRSNGCAPWPAGSVWAFVSGEQMGAPASVAAPETPPGETADISVDMVAPDTPGTYKGFWQLQDASGAPIGDRVYLLIAVPGPTSTPLACPANPALVEVVNELSIQLTVEIEGPQNATFILPGNATRRYCMLPGDYSFVARAAGYSPLTGDKTFNSGGCQCWWFYSGFRVHPLCNCDNDATHYGPLP